jgi:hypothetical protein
MKLLFSILVILFLISCNQTKQNNKELKAKDQTAKEDDSNSMESNTELFYEYWDHFQDAVLSKDFLEFNNLVYFPFEDFYNNIYNPDSTLTCKSLSNFEKKFDIIFTECVINAIKLINIRGYDKNYSQFGDIIAKDDFLLITGCLDRERDLWFKKINGRYYLYGIQYYE